MAEEKEPEVFTALADFKWVQTNEYPYRGFVYQEDHTHNQMPSRYPMILQQSWKGSRGTIVWRDVEIEL